MAFDAGAIIAKLFLDNKEFDKGLSKSGKSINDIQDRAKRLESLLNRSRLGSDRFKNLQKELEKTKTDLASVTQKAKGMNDVIGAIGSVLSAGAIASGLSNLSKQAGALETTTTSFNVLLGSVEKSAKVMADLNKFSLVTPFTPTQVNNAGKALIAFGIEADKVVDVLGRVGDVASGTGKDFNELSVIYGKAFIAGNIYAEDLNQLIEAGVPIISELANVLGVAEGEVKKLASEGKVSFADMEQAFVNMTSEGGKFNNMMALQSQTMEGLASTSEGYSDTIKQSFGSILNEALKPLLRGFISFQETVIDFIQKNPVTVRAITLITLAFTALLGIILGANGLRFAITTLTALMPALGTSMTASLGPVGLAVAGIIASLVTLNAYINDARRNTANSRVDSVQKELEAIADPGRRKALVESLKVISDQVDKGAMSVNNATQAYRQLAKSFPEATMLMGANGKDAKLWAETYANANQTLSNTNKELPKVKTNIAKLKETVPIATKEIQELGNKKEVVSSLSNEFSSFASNLDKVATYANRAMGRIFGEGAMQEFTESTKQALYAIGEGIKSAFSLMQAQAQNALAKIQNRLQKFDLVASVALGRLQKQQEQEFATTEARLNAEVQVFRDSEAEKLKAFENTENAKVDILKQKQLEMEALRNEELQKELARLEAEKQAFLTNERIKFEQRQAELLATTQTQEQERIVKETNEQDWIAFQEQVNREFLDRQYAVQNEFKTREKEENEVAKAELVTTEQATAQAIEAERLASAERIKAREQATANQLTEIKKRQEQEKTDLEKKSALIRYTMEVAGLNVTKQMQRAQAMMSYASTMMALPQLIATMTASTFGLGFPIAMGIASMLGGMATATLGSTLSTISMQQVMPPAELFMEDGGLIGGRRHSNGGTAMGLGVEAERNELFIDRGRTAKLFEWMDSGMGGGVTVNIHAGAFQGVGDLSDQSIDVIASRIGRAIERRAY